MRRDDDVVMRKFGVSNPAMRLFSCPVGVISFCDFGSCGNNQVGKNICFFSVFSKLLALSRYIFYLTALRQIIFFSGNYEIEVA